MALLLNNRSQAPQGACSIRSNASVYADDIMTSSASSHEALQADLVRSHFKSMIYSPCINLKVHRAMLSDFSHRKTLREKVPQTGDDQLFLKYLSDD